jgi:hypothetical protein
MPNPPANWYTDPENPNRLRWWTGTEWSSTLAPLAAPAAAPPVPARPRRAVVVVAIATAILGLIGLAASGFGGLLIMLGLVAITVAIVAVMRGQAPSLGIRSRRGALGALAGGLVVVSLGGGIAPHVDPASSDSAHVASPLTEPSSVASPAATPKPITWTGEERTTSVIPFAETTVDDPTLASGTTAITVPGVAGTRTITWSVTYTDGEESERVKLSEEITTPAVDQVTAIGSYVAPPPPPPAAPSCDPNYGGCVPIASDVDCAGGSGNGPAYQNGPVAVVGSDKYDLDRDGNGIGCD